MIGNVRRLKGHSPRVFLLGCSVFFFRPGKAWFSLLGWGAHGGFPVVPTVDLHVLPSFAVLRQRTNFVRKGKFSGLIIFVTYWLNSTYKHIRSLILAPPGLGLPCVGWNRAYLEIKPFWGRRRQWLRNLICRALTDWERGTVKDDVIRRLSVKRWSYWLWRLVMSLVCFDPSVVAVEKSFIVNQIVSREVAGLYDDWSSNRSVCVGFL